MIDLLQKSRICYYPSAGDDYRDFLYLTPANRIYSLFLEKSVAPPNLHVHTDCRILPTPGIVYADHKTEVRLSLVEEFSCLDLPLTMGITVNPKIHDDLGKCRLFELEIESNTLGYITNRLLYCCCENEAFISKVLIENQIEVPHLIHVRYGGGFGGAYASGEYLLHCLSTLKVELFITDPHLNEQSGDRKALEAYPNLNGERPSLNLLYKLRGKCWSNHGTVSWYLCKKNNNSRSDFEQALYL